MTAGNTLETISREGGRPGRGPRLGRRSIDGARDSPVARVLFPRIDQAGAPSGNVAENRQVSGVAPRVAGRRRASCSRIESGRVEGIGASPAVGAGGVRRPEPFDSPVGAGAWDAGGRLGGSRRRKRGRRADGHGPRAPSARRQRPTDSVTGLAAKGPRDERNAARRGLQPRRRKAGANLENRPPPPRAELVGAGRTADKFRWRRGIRISTRTRTMSSDAGGGGERSLSPVRRVLDEGRRPRVLPTPISRATRRARDHAGKDGLGRPERAWTVLARSGLSPFRRATRPMSRQGRAPQRKMASRRRPFQDLGCGDRI